MTEWVKMESGTMRMFCERCGASYQPTLPCPIGLMADMADSFVGTHESCEAKKPKEDCCRYHAHYGTQCPYHPKGKK